MVEAFLLKNAGQTVFSYIVFTLPAEYFLMQLILGINMHVPAAVGRVLGQVSMFIYCVPPMIVELTEDIFRSSIAHFVFTALTSTVLGLMYLFVRKTIDRKKVKLCST